MKPSEGLKPAEVALSLPSTTTSLAPQPVVKFNRCRKIRQHPVFFKFHFLLVVLSFFIPGILSFYDSDPTIMQRATTACTIPLVLCHSIINIIVVLDNANNITTTGRLWKYVLCWSLYDLVKILLVIIHLARGAQTGSDNQILPFVVLIFLIFEGVNFFVTEFDTPRNLYTILLKHMSKLAWIMFTMLLTVYSFSFLGYCMFKTTVKNEAKINEWIEGSEFDNIIQSFITMMDIKDWFNSYLIGAIESERPGSLLFFYIYIILTRIIETLFLGVVIQLFTDPVTEQLILSLDKSQPTLKLTTHDTAGARETKETKETKDATLRPTTEPTAARLVPQKPPTAPQKLMTMAVPTLRPAAATRK